MMTQPIDFYFSLLSPWSYLGYEELLRLSRQYNAPIQYHPVDIIDVFANTGGLPMSKRHESRQAYRFYELKRWSRRRNIPLNLKPQFFPFNPKAADLTLTALLHAGINPEAFILGIYRAIWQQDLNCADNTIISSILATSLPEHIPQGQMQSLLDFAQSEECANIYVNATQSAISNNIFGAPFMIYNSEPFWGQDRLDFLEEALRENYKSA